mmetsp:Transcript_5784/g.16246  ORF Transcript_5784/g.16246 Transcript_5784/m.16246 type:complete len:341 (-) Transcript_5784:683-1705(-)
MCVQVLKSAAGSWAVGVTGKAKSTPTLSLRGRSPPSMPSVTSDGSASKSPELLPPGDEKLVLPPGDEKLVFGWSEMGRGGCRKSTSTGGEVGSEGDAWKSSSTCSEEASEWPPSSTAWLATPSSEPPPLRRGAALSSFAGTASSVGEESVPNTNTSWSESAGGRGQKDAIFMRASSTSAWKPKPGPSSLASETEARVLTAALRSSDSSPEKKEEWREEAPLEPLVTEPALLLSASCAPAEEAAPPCPSPLLRLGVLPALPPCEGVLLGEASPPSLGSISVWRKLYWSRISMRMYPRSSSSLYSLSGGSSACGIVRLGLRLYSLCAAASISSRCWSSCFCS